MVFSWITGLPRMPTQGDMSIILQVRLSCVCLEMLKRLLKTIAPNYNLSLAAWGREWESSARRSHVRALRARALPHNLHSNVSSLLHESLTLILQVLWSWLPSLAEVGAFQSSLHVLSFYQYNNAKSGTRHSSSCAPSYSLRRRRAGATRSPEMSAKIV